MAQTFTSPVVAAAHQRQQTAEFARLLVAAREVLKFDDLQRISDAMGISIPAVETLFGQALHYKETQQ
jgi:hypothetical protein